MLRVVFISVLAAVMGVAQGTCDRACLIRTADQYFAALAAHDPAKLRMTATMRFVENSVATSVGEGLWKTASAVPTTFRLNVPDPVSQQIGVIAMMEENGKPIQLGLRLKLVNGGIAEAEHLVVRNIRDGQLNNLKIPRQGLLATIPVAQRLTREQMLKIGASYYDALDDNKGSAAPFADDCIRRENGMQTNGNPLGLNPTSMQLIGAMRCGPQMDTGGFQYIDRIENRRVDIADPETGLVFGLSHFRHSMKEKVYKVSGLPGFETHTVDANPFDLPAAHIFQTRGGEIHEIEALGFALPYNASGGWE